MPRPPLGKRPFISPALLHVEHRFASVVASAGASMARRAFNLEQTPAPAAQMIWTVRLQHQPWDGRRYGNTNLAVDRRLADGLGRRGELVRWFHLAEGAKAAWAWRKTDRTWMP